MKKLFFKISNSFAFFLAILTTCEVVTYLYYTPSGQDFAPIETATTPNLRHSIKYCKQNKLCYDVNYHFNEYGHRSLPHQNKPKHLLIFGDSISFGDGLMIEDTFAYHLNENTDFQVYNFAKSGTGPNYALHTLETSTIEKQVKERTGLAIFLLFNFHIERTSYNTRRYWAWNFPAYHLDGDQLIKDSNQLAQIKDKEWIYIPLGWLRKYSTFFKQFNLNYSPYNKQENIQTMIKVLKETQTQYENSFDGKFIVVGAPVAGPSKEVVNLLAQNNIPYLSLEDKGFDYHRLCECDPHPNRESNKSFYELIKKHILEIKKAP